MRAAALAESPRTAKWPWIAALSGANFGLWVALYGPLQLLLGLQAQAMAPSQKVAVFGLVTTVGALFSVVANPLFGALSDRTTSRFGRRLPWVLFGALGGALSLILLSTAGSIAIMVLGWSLVQISLNAMFAALTAAVPDQVPAAQQGTVGSCLGAAQIGGVVGGAAIVSAGLPNIQLGYFACVAMLAVFTAFYLLFRQDIVLDRRLLPIFSWPRFLAGFWINPRLHPDFGWAWVSRFTFNLVYAVGTLYLLFYLDDILHRPNPTGDVVVMTAVNVGAMLLVMFPAALLSDRFGRRKIFITVGGVLLACGMAILALWPEWTGALIAAAALGLGMGIYLPADLALMIQVLPNAADRGRDLGVLNVANTLPQVFAPAIAGLVVTWAGYPALYMFCAVMGLCSVAMVRRVRRVV